MAVDPHTKLVREEAALIAENTWAVQELEQKQEQLASLLEARAKEEKKARAVEIGEQALQAEILKVEQDTADLRRRTSAQLISVAWSRTLARRIDTGEAGTKSWPAKTGPWLPAPHVQHLTFAPMSTRRGRSFDVRATSLGPTLYSTVAPAVRTLATVDAAALAAVANPVATARLHKYWHAAQTIAAAALEEQAQGVLFRADAANVLRVAQAEIERLLVAAAPTENTTPAPSQNETQAQKTAATSATAANYTARSKGQQGIDVDLLHGIVRELRMAVERLQSSEDREGGEAIP